MKTPNAIVSTNSGAVFRGNQAAFLDIDGNLNTNAMRPYLNKDGIPMVNVYVGGDPKNIKSYKGVEVQHNATLRRDEWKLLDDALQRQALTRLDGVQDLVNENLVLDLGGNGMATTVLEHHTKDQPFTASVSMDGVVKGDNDRPNYDTVYTPLPITHVDYMLTARELAVSRKLGNPLNVDDAVDASRAVLLKREQMLFTDITYKFGGGYIYSYVNHPNRNTVAVGTNWASDTVAHIYTDVKAMKQALINKNQSGPYALYYPQDCETKFDDDYSTTTATNMTLRERVMKMQNMKICKAVDTLATGNYLMVNLNTNTVRLIRGMPMQNLEWSIDGGMVFNYKVMSIEIPQIRADAANQCGVCHGTAD